MTMIRKWWWGRFFVVALVMAMAVLLLSNSGGAQAHAASSLQETADTFSADLSPPAFTAELGVSNTNDGAVLTASMNATARDGTISRASPGVSQVATLTTLSLLGVLALVTLLPRRRARVAGMARTFDEVRRMGVWFGIVPFRQHPI